MLILSRISIFALLVFLLSPPQCWARAKVTLDCETDEHTFAPSRSKIDDIEGLRGAGAASKLKGKTSSRYNRLLQTVKAAPKASPEGDAVSFIRTVSSNDLKQLAGVQNIVYNKDRLHLPGQGGLFIQTLLSHKDYAKANPSTASKDAARSQSFFAKIWLWWISWWSPQPRNNVAD